MTVPEKLATNDFVGGSNCLSHCLDSDFDRCLEVNSINTNSNDEVINIYNDNEVDSESDDEDHEK